MVSVCRLYLRDGATLVGTTKMLTATCLPTPSNPVAAPDAASQGVPIALTLESSHFYPQGGGQPCDQGKIWSERFNCRIHGVKYDSEGSVRYEGTLHKNPDYAHRSDNQSDDAVITITGPLPTLVSYEVDAERRKLHCRLHTGGHLVDLAMHIMEHYTLPSAENTENSSQRTTEGVIRHDFSKYAKWREVISAAALKPKKGHHFPDGPNVEYQGKLEFQSPQAREAFTKDFEELCNELIQMNLATRVLFPQEKDGGPCLGDDAERQVAFEGFPNLNVPCGGTHVSHLKEIGALKIRKVQSSGGVTKVGYAIVP